MEATLTRYLVAPVVLGILAFFTSCRADRHTLPTPAGTQSIPAASASAAPSSSRATSAESASPVASARVPVARLGPEARDNFPCRGCETRIPATEDIAAPAPLLVVLHGDLGDVSRMTKVWRKAAHDRGMVLTSLLCPRDKGCKGSWWKWYQDASHDPSWIGEQIDAVSREIAIDPARVYAAGYSGGASYLGYYGPMHPERFAAVAYVAGGVRFVSECSPRKTPVLFLIGNQDPMLTLYVNKLHVWYEACGHPISWRVLPGVTHDGIVPLLQAGKGIEVVEWMKGAGEAQ